jgi:hypothetical protein
MIFDSASTHAAERAARPHSSLWPRRRITSAAVLVLAATASLVLLAAAQAKPPAATPSKSTGPAPARADTTALPHRVIAYYLHTTYRCVTCRKIEAYSREAIEAAFPQELKDGRLVWRVVNFEEKGNKHFVKDFQLYTKSLVLVDEVKGKQVRWKNLAKVWELLPNKDGFFSYVQSEARSYLAGKS